MNRTLFALALCAAAAALLLVGCPTEAPEPDPCVDASRQLAPGVGEAAGVWHEASQRLVWFGGNEQPPEQCMFLNDYSTSTWSFNARCDSYEPVETGDEPPSRARHIAVLDSARDRMLIHGGRSRDEQSGPYTQRDDLWALDLTENTWTELDPSGGGPSARSSHAAVVVDDQMILFGGNTSTSGLSYTPQRDVWSLDLASLEWTELSTTNPPPARLFHKMAASPDGATIYAFAGGDENAFQGPLLSDLWALDVASLEWTMLEGNGPIVPNGEAPSTRFSPDLFAIPGDKLLMFAGHDELTGPTNVIWEYDVADGSWDRLERGDVYNTPANGFCDFPADFTEIDPDAPERRYFGVSGITDAGDLVTFGGRTDCGLVNDTWSWTAADGWTRRTVSSGGEVCLRNFAECADMCTPE